jgi:hypothetical protein
VSYWLEVVRLIYLGVKIEIWLISNEGRMPYFPGKTPYVVDTIKYPRMGKPWTKDEDQKLLSSIKEGDSIRPTGILNGHLTTQKIETPQNGIVST